MSVTIITYFYNSGGGGSGDNDDSSIVNDNGGNGGNITNTSTDNNLVIFTDKFNLHIVKRLFDTTKVYIVDTQDVIKHNISNGKHIGDIITMMNIIQYVLVVNPFDSHKFVWMDINYLPLNRIVYSRVSDTKIDIFVNSNSSSVNNYGSSKQCWLDFCHWYHNNTNYKLDTQQNVEQQHVINKKCITDNPSLFRIITSSEYWIPSKYIIPRMQAGLGNRLFIYAAALGASSLNISNSVGGNSGNNKSVIILPAHTETNVHGTKPVHGYFYRNNNVNAGNVIMEHKYSDKPYQSGVYTPIPHVSSDKHLLIDGFFQSDKYWLQIKQSIVDQYSCPDFLKDSYRYLFNLGNDKTCFIHIRRGDYLKLPLHNVNLHNYYQAALQLFPLDTVFLVFSDDLNYCRNYSLLKTRNVLFVDKNETESLWIMSLCYGAICVNSSFSWWGSYLQTNPTLPRILPSKMFTDTRYRVNDFYPQTGYTIVNV